MRIAVLLLAASAAAAEGPATPLPADGTADAAAVETMDAKERERRLGLALAGIAKEFAEVKSLRSGFVQRKRLEVLDEEAVTKGTMALEMPSRLRWEYTEPVKTLLVVNGQRAKRVRTSRKGEATATTFDLREEPIAAATAEQVFLWVGGRTEEARKSHVLTLLAEKPLRVRATPRDERVAKVIASVELEFAEGRTHLARIVLAETSKARTEIAFDAVERNPTLAADLFDVR